MVDPAARRTRLGSGLARAAAGVGGEVVPNPGLLEENTFLVEYPSVVVGNFEDKFLALPDEVLITSMREHQRYFSLRGKDGKLLPHFIAVNNTLTRDPDVVRQGHERVLRARLSDAMYFFQVDAKMPLENRVEALKGVMFHSLLGTSYEKMERFRELAVSAWPGNWPRSLQEVVATGRHPVQGRHRHGNGGGIPQPPGGHGREVLPAVSGEPPEVADGPLQPLSAPPRRRHTPRRPGGGPGGPGGPAGHHLRLLRGGSGPHGHRRPLRPPAPRPGRHPHPAQPAAASGLGEPWPSTLKLLKDKLSRSLEETALEVLDFFQTRLQHLLLAEGCDHETMAAVLAAGCRDVVDAADKVAGPGRDPPQPGVSRPWPWPLKGLSISPRGPNPAR